MKVLLEKANFAKYLILKKKVVPFVMNKQVQNLCLKEIFSVKNLYEILNRRCKLRL